MLNTRMRVLLIAPTALDYQGRPIKERRLHLPCLTLPLLAALTPPQVEVKIIYETVEDIPFDDHWDLVGLTGMGSGIVRAWEIADEFRSRGVPVIIGGIAASLGDPIWSLRHADAVVIGEAEILWKEAITDFECKHLQNLYRSVRLQSLDNLPIPRYDLMNRWRMGLWRPVQATRGCPHKCSFCSVTAFCHGSFRKRPIKEVIRDVRMARHYGSRYIAFVDDNIVGDIDYCVQLWEALIPERIVWMSQSTLRLAEYPALLKLARRSGCRLMSIGIESTNKDSLRSVHKEWNGPERYNEAIRAFRRNGIEVSTEMIIGFDTDDISAFQKTLRFIIDNRISVPRVHILTPVPGTPLFEELDRLGRITVRDFSSYTGGKVIFQPKMIEPSLLQSEYWKLYKKLFSWPSILRRLMPNEASLGLYMRLVVLAANIRYRGHVRRRISPGIL